MKILIVHAHPEPNSFNSSLVRSAVDWCAEQGFEVQVSDLYAMGFNPVGGVHDFTHEAPDFFKYQLEQVKAIEQNSFSAELQLEMDKLQWCDVLIFNFPLWWFGLPAILKGWVDRVFAMGFAYGNGKGVYENGVFPEKRGFCTITTGGPEVAYNGGKNGDLAQILYPINHGMLYFVGMQVLEPFVSFSPARKEKAELEKEIVRYRDYLDSIFTQKPMY